MLAFLLLVTITHAFRHRFVFMSSRDYSPSGLYKNKVTSIPTSTSRSTGSVTSVGIDDQETQRISLKSRLFARCAACDRGYGANNNDRIAISDLISEMQLISAEKTPTRGLYPNNNTIDSDAVTPLEGVWQMVYTSAYDVLSLAASPLTIVQGIYQVICANGTVVNVIDLAPRTQALLPVQIQKKLGSTLRAKVKISGRARSDQRVSF